MERRVRRGRPKLSRRPVIKGFEYDNYHEPVRIMMLCQGLKALRWVNDDMDMQAFIKLFSGDDVYQRIVEKSGPFEQGIVESYCNLYETIKEENK